METAQQILSLCSKIKEIVACLSVDLTLEEIRNGFEVSENVLMRCEAAKRQLVPLLEEIQVLVQKLGQMAEIQDGMTVSPD
jgi:hypothetical protein